jgi:hypothetical protein
MTNTLRNPLLYAWSFLVLATIASWWLGGEGHDTRDQFHALMPLVVLIIAVIKCRVVIRSYMEVKHAPAWLQLSCDAWLLLNLAMASSLYWA